MTAPAPGDERLIVVPVDALRAAGLAQGFDPSPDSILAAAFQPGIARVMPRSAAEADPRFKQLVCYVILRHGGQVFHYRRSAGVGERRLAGLRSLGVGGHLNAGDAGSRIDLASTGRAIRRELDEEVCLTEEPSVRYLGVINDDSQPVGRVHLGIVALAELCEPRVHLRDSALTDGRFDPPEALGDRAESFETWSQLCLPTLVSLPVAS